MARGSVQGRCTRMRCYARGGKLVDYNGVLFSRVRSTIPAYSIKKLKYL